VAVVAEVAVTSPRGTGPATKGWYAKTEFNYGSAVYSCAFSPCGRFVAAGGFSGQVRAWDLRVQSEVLSAPGHAMPCHEVAWSADSSEIASCGHDGRVRVWDVARGRQAASWELSGLLQAVQVSWGEPSLLLAAGNDARLVFLDRRQPTPARQLTSEAPIHSLYAFVDGRLLASGDAAGAVKMWDTRAGAVVERLVVSAERPISCVSIPRRSGPHAGLEDGPLLAANCFDNTLRLYAHALGFLSPATTAPASPSPSPSGIGGTSASAGGLRPLRTLTGLKNKNWPIKSCFFWGKEHRRPSSEETPRRERTLGEQLLLISGSADGVVYVWDLSADGAGPDAGAPPPLLRLEAHSDRVYSVACHPTEPILASASADFHLKLWMPAKTKPVPSLPTTTH
jgi:COMPASS component SWD3